MARPRKMTDEQMLDVVRQFCVEKLEGDVRLLKYSRLAEYAKGLGYDVEAYDIRRNEVVRTFVEELKTGTKHGERVPEIYRTLNIPEFLNRNRGDALPAALAELDEYWRATATRAMKSSEERNLLEKQIKETEAELAELRRAHKQLLSERNALTAENRYLRKMLKTYLYPAVADRILMNENAIAETDTELTQTANDEYIEKDAPKSFEASVTRDALLQHEEEGLLASLWRQCDE